VLTGGLFFTHTPIHPYTHTLLLHQGNIRDNLFLWGYYQDIQSVTFKHNYCIKEYNVLRIDKDTLTLMPDLLDEIHDRYFEFDDVVFDRESGELKLSLGDKREVVFGKVIVSKSLKISSVSDCICNDTAKISQNSINKIDINAEDGFIDIECNAPAEFRIYIKPDFEIFLECAE